MLPGLRARADTPVDRAWSSPLIPRPGPFFPPMGHPTPTVGSPKGPPQDAMPGVWRQRAQMAAPVPGTR